MKEETKLHWLRVRQKDSNEPFSDPYADITFVVPAVLKELHGLYGDSSDVDYMKAIFSVFITRLEEDATPVSKQIEQFLTAYDKLPKELRDTLQADFMAFILMLFALYVRRDSKANAEETRNIKLSAAYMFMKQILSDDLCKALEAEFKDKLLPATAAEPQEAQVDAVCVETEEHIKDIKDIVHKMFSVTGKQDWESIAAACDKYMQETTTEGTKDIAAALAYPDYKSPYFEAETSDTRSNSQTSDSTAS